MRHLLFFLNSRLISLIEDFSLASTLAAEDKPLSHWQARPSETYLRDYSLLPWYLNDRYL